MSKSSVSKEAEELLKHIRELEQESEKVKQRVGYYKFTPNYTKLIDTAKRVVDSNGDMSDVLELQKVLIQLGEI